MKKFILVSMIVLASVVTQADPESPLPPPPPPPSSDFPGCLSRGEVVLYLQNIDNLILESKNTEAHLSLGDLLSRLKRCSY